MAGPRVVGTQGFSRYECWDQVDASWDKEPFLYDRNDKFMHAC